jgi:hypothetical protein
MVWINIERVCISFFTLEYGLRLYACPLLYGAKPHTPVHALATEAENKVSQDPKAVRKFRSLGEIRSWRDSALMCGRLSERERESCGLGLSGATLLTHRQVKRIPSSAGSTVQK